MLFLKIDSFTDVPFGGNPAAVVLLREETQDAGWMQNVAREMNLSETAFIAPGGNDLPLRWFTPTTEVDLCGHATLAAAHALWSEGLLDPSQPARFHTLSGILTAERDGAGIRLDFPAEPPAEAEVPSLLLEALGVTRPIYTGRNRLDFLVQLESPDAVRTLEPDFGRLRMLPGRGVIVTAEGGDRADFTSRYFAPAFGIDEDPVTGSTHCCLAPFWVARLGRNPLTGHQASARGGYIRVETRGDRVMLTGRAVTVARGTLLV